MVTWLRLTSCTMVPLSLRKTCFRPLTIQQCSPNYIVQQKQNLLLKISNKSLLALLEASSVGVRMNNVKWFILSNVSLLPSSTHCISLLLRVHRISTKTLSLVPSPCMASCRLSANRIPTGTIIASTTRSKLPPNSDLRSLMRSCNCGAYKWLAKEADKQYVMFKKEKSIRSSIGSPLMRLESMKNNTDIEASLTRAY